MVADHLPTALITHGGLAAQSRRPTEFNRPHDSLLLTGESMGGAIGLPIGPHDIGQFEAWLYLTPLCMGTHGLVPQARIIQLIQGGGCIQQPPTRQMEVVEGCADIGVPQEPLDGMRVRPSFQEVRRERMSEGMDTT